MSKYTPEQLKAMAKTAVVARNEGDERYTRLIISLSVALNLDPQHVDQKIIDLAQWGGVDNATRSADAGNITTKTP